MEEPRIPDDYRPVQPFDATQLLASIFRYRQDFLDEVKLLGSVPDELEEIKAKLYFYVNQRRGDGLNTDDLRELCTLLPGLSETSQDQLPIARARDLIDDISSIDVTVPLDRASPHLISLDKQIARLYRIAQELSDDEVFYNLLNRLIQYYEKYCDALCTPGADIAKLLKPLPTICGTDVGYSQIVYELALRVLTRTDEGIVVRENDHGEASTVRVGGLFFKAKRVLRELDYGYANAAAYAYQILNRRFRVATPATLFVIWGAMCKLSGKPSEALQRILEYSNQTPCMRNVVQATAVSEGNLFHDVLQLELAFKNWTKVFSQEALLLLLQEVDNPEKLRDLQSTSGIDSKIVDQLPRYLKMMPSLMANFTLEQAINVMPSIRQRIDHYSKCAKVVADIWIIAKDMKSDNENFCSVLDPGSGKTVHYLEGFDVDKAFGVHIIKSKRGHHINVRSVDLFDDLDIPFDPELKQEMLQFPAIYVWLSWMGLVHDDEKRFLSRVAQMVFRDRDRFEEGSPTLGIPVLFNAKVPDRMFRMYRRMQEILPRINTLREFVGKIQPLLLEYIDLVNALYPGNILKAYEMHHTELTIESVYEDSGKVAPDLSSYNTTEIESDTRTMSCEAAIASVLESHRHEGSVEERCRFLDFVGGKFPFVSKLAYTKNELETLLLSFAESMFPNTLEQLSRCGVNFGIKAENDETVLHRVLSREHLDKIFESRRIINFLLNHKQVDFEAVCSKGNTPLFAFLRSAKFYPVEFISFVVGLFVQKSVDINKEVCSKTALDVAVELESPNLFSALVYYKACYSCDFESVVNFVLKFQSDPLVQEGAKHLSNLNPYFYFDWSLRRVSRFKKDGDHTVSIEGNHRSQYFLHSDVARQLFDERGALKPLAKIEFEGQLLFYALGESDCSTDEIKSSRFHQVFKSNGGAYGDVFKVSVRNGGEIRFYLIGASEGMDLEAILKDETLRQKVLGNIDNDNITKFAFIYFLLGLSLSPKSMVVSLSQIQGKPGYILKTLPFTSNSSVETEQEFDVQSMLSPFQSLRSVRMGPQAMADLLNMDALEVLKIWNEMLLSHEFRLTNLALESHRSRSSFARSNRSQIEKIGMRSGEMQTLFYRHQSMLDILRGMIGRDCSLGDFIECAASLFVVPKKTEVELITPRRAQGLLSIVSPRLAVAIGSPRGKESPRQPKNVTAQSDEKSAVRTITLVEAGNELNSLKNDMQLLSKAVGEVQVGVFTSYHKITGPLLKQRSINAVVWGSVPGNGEVHNAILSEAAKHSYTEFTAINCVYLTDKVVTGIFMNSHALRVLNLSGSKKFNDGLLSQLVRFCPAITDIIIDRTLVSKLILLTLPQLKLLSAADCSELVEAEIDAPTLTAVNFKSSKRLKQHKLHARPENLVEANYDQCESLDPEFLRRLAVLAYSLRTLRHLGVPEFNRCGLVSRVSRNKEVTPEIARSLIQFGVLSLYGINLPEEMLYRVIGFLSKETKGNLLHRTQRLTTLDLRGCSYGPRVLAYIIATTPTLTKMIFQSTFKPTGEAPVKIQPKSIKAVEFKDVKEKVTGEPIMIEKVLGLPDGNTLIFYNDGSFKVCDIDSSGSAKLIRSGKVGKAFYDADILPNNDLIVCTDSGVKILNSTTWDVVEKLKSETSFDDIIYRVRVIGNKRLVLGGKHLSIYEIDRGKIQFKKSVMELSIKSMVLTPNQKLFVAQSESQGTIIWRLIDNRAFEEVQFDMVGQVSKNVGSIIVIDDFNVILVDDRTGDEMNLNLNTKEITRKKHALGVNFGVIGPGGNVLMGGTKLSDFVVCSRQTNQECSPYKQMLHVIFEHQTGQMRAPCVTSDGDLLVSVDKSLWLIKNESQSVDLTFAQFLPSTMAVSLTRSKDQTAEIKITYPKRPVAFTVFLEKFFGASQCTLLCDETSVIIGRIPLEEACIYQMMFETLFKRAKDSQKSSSANLRSGFTPRSPDSASNFFPPQDDNDADDKGGDKHLSNRTSLFSYGSGDDDNL